MNNPLAQYANESNGFACVYTSYVMYDGDTKLPRQLISC